MIVIKRRKKRTPLWIVLFFILFSFLCIYPFYYVLVLSFNDATDAMRGGIYFWPRQVSFASYRQVFQNKYLAGSFLISVARVILMMVLVPVTCSLYAYALAQNTLPGRKFFRYVLVLPMYIGGGIIPFYMLLRSLHLTNTFWVYIVPGMFSSFNVLLFRSFFSEVSASLRESAILDGAGEIQVFLRIIVPVSKPVFAAVALFTGVGAWNEWMSGQLYVSNPNLYPLATILHQIIRSVNGNMTGITSGVDLTKITEMGNRVTTESLRYAMIVVTTVPILAIYPFMQRYFIHGIMIGSVKE